MSDEPAEPRGHRGEALSLALREDLELYSVDDLDERVGLLRAEIARTEGNLANLPK